MSTVEIEDLKEQIENYQAQRDNAEQQLRILDGKLQDAQLEYEVQTNPEILVAEELHRIQCHHNHTDACGWFYEDWNDKIGYSRKSYLEKAKKLLAEDVMEQPKDVLRVLRMVR